MKGGNVMPLYCNKEYKKLIRPLPDFTERDMYDIPVIKKQEIDITNLNNGKWLIGCNNVSYKDKHPEQKIVHMFKYDRVLSMAYNNPDKFLEKTSKYYAICTPDFSMDKKMDFPLVLKAVYDNRWMGAYAQANGRKVIACVGWTTKETYDICFAGLEDGAVFIISTIGSDNKISNDEFIRGYNEMRTRFPLSKIICVGNKIQGMDSDICYVKYKESFGNWDRYNNYWQPKLFNWDNSLSENLICG